MHQRTPRRVCACEWPVHTPHLIFLSISFSFSVASRRCSRRQTNRLGRHLCSSVFFCCVQCFVCVCEWPVYILHIYDVSLSFLTLVSRGERSSRQTIVFVKRVAGARASPFRLVFSVFFCSCRLRVQQQKNELLG